MTIDSNELNLQLADADQETILSLPWLQTETADFSIGSSQKDMKWRKTNWSFARVIIELMQHNIGPKDGRSFLQGCLAENRSPRNKKAMTEMHLLALDIDNGFPLEDMVKKIEKQNWLAVLYTSHSHGKSVSEISAKQIINKLDLEKPEKDLTPAEVKQYLLEFPKYHPPLLKNMTSEITHSTAGLVAKVTHAPMDKYRVVFFLSDTFNPGTVADTHDLGMQMWAKKYAGVAQLLEIEFDAACTDVSRLFYYGRHNKDAPYISKLISGDTLILDDIEDGSPSGYIKKTGNKTLDAIAMEEALQTPGGKKLDYSPHINGIYEFYQEHRETFQAHDFWDTHGDGVTSPVDTEGKDHFECPNHISHTNPEAMSGFVVANPGSHHEDSSLIKCSHTGCNDRTDWMFIDQFMEAHDLELEDLLDFVPDGGGGDTLASIEDFEKQAEKKARVKKEEVKEQKVMSKGEVPEPGVYTDAIINLGIDEDDYFDGSEDQQDFISILAALSPDVVNKAIIVPALIKSLIKLDLETFTVSEYLTLIAKQSGFSKRMVNSEYKEGKVKAKRPEPIDGDTRYSEDAVKVLTKMNTQHTTIQMGSKMVVMHDLAYRKNPGKGMLSFLNVVDFKNKLSNKRIGVFDETKGEVLSKPAAEAWLDWPGRRDHSELRFDPAIDVEDLENIDYGLGLPYNMWNGFRYKSDPDGKCDIFLEHVRKHICHDDKIWYDFFMSWMAHMIQVPEEIPGCAIIVQGEKACGKSIVFEEILVKEILNPYGMKTAEVSKIFGSFNALVKNKLLVVMTEAFWAGSKEIESSMKDAITSSSYTLSLKGIDDVEVHNYRRFACTANAQFVVPATKDERRFFVLKCKSTKVGKPEYFGAMMEELEEKNGYGKLMHILENWPEPKQGWKSYFFKPPVTPWLEEQIAENTPVHERWFFDALIEGGTQETPQNEYLEDIIFNEDEETILPRALFNKWWKHETRTHLYAAGPKKAKNFIIKNFPEFVLMKKQIPSNLQPTDCYIIPPLSKLKETRPAIFSDQA